MLGDENQVDEDHNKIKLDLGGNDEDQRSTKIHELKKSDNKDRANCLSDVSPVVKCSKPANKWMKRWVLVPNVF